MFGYDNEKKYSRHFTRDNKHYFYRSVIEISKEAIFELNVSIPLSRLQATIVCPHHDPFYFWGISEVLTWRIAFSWCLRRKLYSPGKHKYANSIETQAETTAWVVNHQQRGSASASSCSPAVLGVLFYFFRQHCEFRSPRRHNLRKILQRIHKGNLESL